MQRLQLDHIIKIGARGSPLSLAQTGQLRVLLGASLGIDQDEFYERLPIVPITTTGDRIQDRPLSEAGGKGLFTKELDEALLDGRIDCAVHSLKDVPNLMPDGVVLLGGPSREDRRDALVSLQGYNLSQIPWGGVIGTASLRRGAQLRFVRPDLKTVVLRGNVGTRLNKLSAGGIDATLLAAAGLVRLRLLNTPHTLLDPEEMPPAIGQGALAITARRGDQRVIDAFARICDPQTYLETQAERAFLSTLDGSCRTAIGALARIESDGSLTFIGEALSDDGQTRWRRSACIDLPTLANVVELGARLGQEVKSAMFAGLVEATQ